jgi:hypothetical protein
VPALVAGLVTRRRGRDASILRALCEGVYTAAVFGVVPLLIAIVLTRAPGSTGPVATPR